MKYFKTKYNLIVQWELVVGGSNVYGKMGKIVKYENDAHGNMLLNVAISAQQILEDIKLLTEYDWRARAYRLDGVYSAIGYVPKVQVLYEVPSISCRKCNIRNCSYAINSEIMLPTEFFRAGYLTRARDLCNDNNAKIIARYLLTRNMLSSAHEKAKHKKRKVSDQLPEGVIPELEPISDSFLLDVPSMILNSR